MGSNMNNYEALSRLNFEKWMANDYLPDHSQVATEADENAFQAVMWHIWQSAQLPLLAELDKFKSVAELHKENFAGYSDYVASMESNETKLMERIAELEQCHAETTEVLKQSHADTLAAHQLIERLQGQSPIAWIAGAEEIRDFQNGREVYVMRDCDDSELEYLPLYAAPQPSASVVVPDEIRPEQAQKIAPAGFYEMDNDELCVAAAFWNACLAEVLRLNSGSKPKRFVVKLPEPDVYEVNGTRFYDRLKDTEVIEAILAAGGEIAE